MTDSVLSKQGGRLSRATKRGGHAHDHPVPKSQPPPPPKAPLPRPDLDEKMTALPANVAASLTTALEKLKNAAPAVDLEASGDQGNGATFC
nr:unnamed protein product [Spirometra erinaceieuropaei]